MKQLIFKHNIPHPLVRKSLTNTACSLQKPTLLVLILKIATPVTLVTLYLQQSATFLWLDNCLTCI